MIRTEVAVCGAGASGMAAAAAAARAGDRVTLLEKADRPGKKLLATGNGRCNLMNLNPPVYFGDAGFAAGVELAVVTDGTHVGRGQPDGGGHAGR